MIIRDQDITEIDEEIWDRFISGSNNGTLFCRPRFYRHHDAPADVRFIGCYDGGDLVAGVVGAFDEEGTGFNSPVKASYGGLILPSVSFSDTEKALTVMMEYFKTIDVQRIQFTFPPLPYQRELRQDLDFLLKYHGFRETQVLISSMTFTEGHDDKALSSMCRRAVKKARKKGVTIKSVDDVEAFYHILEQNKQKFDLEPTHSLDEIRRLLELFPDEIALLGAWIDETLIAGVMNMKCNDQALLTFYICSLEQYQKLRPVNLLLHQVCINAREEGIPVVDFGVSMETDTDNPMDPRRSLIFFKEHYNSRGFLRTRYEWSKDSE